MPWKDKEKQRISTAKWRAIPENAERNRKQTREWRKNNPDYAKKRWRRVRDAIVNALGGQCACCGERGWAFLTIDHINGDGAAHRRRGSGRGTSIMSDVAREVRLGTAHERYRILCYNCNSGRYRNGGICPHAER